jgi:glucose/arabinose dehydrogenase
MTQFSFLQRYVWRCTSAILVLAASAACAPSARLPVAAVTGPTPTISAPQTSRIPTVNVAKAVGWSGKDHPVAATGTIVNAFARGLDHPRWLYVLPNGDVLVAESNAPVRPDDRTGIRSWFLRLFMHEGGAGDPSANRITLLRDADGDGVAETRSVFLSNLNSPFGMALVGNTLYVANTDGVVRFPYTPGQIEITSSPTKVVDLPAGTINHHWTRGLVANADGSKLYVSVGANSDYGERGMENEVDRAAIWEVDTKTGNNRIFASGMRNPVGLAWVPETGALWAAVNEREELGPDLPPDYMTAVHDHGFYGWPYSYHGANVDTRVNPQRPDLVGQAIVPDYALGPHTASLGLAYATGTSLPSRFNNGMIVTQHGSWNRIPRSGYRVVFVPFTGGKPAGAPIALLTGFLNSDDDAQGRPVGVAVDKRGGVLIADDAGNVIWRVVGSQPVQVVADINAQRQPTILERFADQVRSAEADGAKFPSAGSASATYRRCVDANMAVNPQSGEFSVGGYSLYDATWHQGLGKLVWKPAYPVSGVPLLVRAISLDSAAAPIMYRLPEMTGSIADNTAIYSAPVRLPRPGNWLLTPEAGTNWGCFLYTLR